MRVNVIGSGIAGPAAALTLAAHGHDVTVYDRRPAGQIRSYGVIGITELNCSRLRELGTDLSTIALDNMYHEWTTDGMQSHRMSSQKFVVWTDVHNLLTRTAQSNGATFKYGRYGVHGDLTVQASGLAYASRRGLRSNLRYVVYRGLSSMPTDYAWLSLNDPRKRFSFKLAHSPYGSSWELYAHRDNIHSSSKSEAELPAECNLLPKQFKQIVDYSTNLASSPISDWEVPHEIRTPEMITIGDANGGMRPHTGMGANLGVAEALAIPDMISDSNLQSVFIAERLNWRARGIEIGKGVMGR